MKTLVTAIAAAAFAIASSAAYAGGAGGCDYDSKRQTTAETLLPNPQSPSTGS